MDAEKIKKLIEVARESVVDEKEPFKTEAFKITFSKLLDQNLLKIPFNEPEQLTNTISLEENTVLTSSNFNEKMSNFAKKCQLTTKDLNDVFYIVDDLINLIAPMNGSESEKQILVARCILTAYDQLFGKEWVSSTLLTKCVDSSGILGLDHFARNIRRKKYFRVRGKGKGATLEYKITEIGRLETFQIIHDMVRGA